MTGLATFLLVLVLLPLAQLWLAALLALRDGGRVAWELVRVLLITAIALSLIIRFGDDGTFVVVVALGIAVSLHLAGFWIWRLWGIGVPIDKS